MGGLPLLYFARMNIPAYSKLVSWAIVTSAIGVNVAAHADEGDAFNFFVGESVRYDDNLFRLSDGVDTEARLGKSQRSDTIFTTFAGVTFDKMISRQALHADLQFNNNRYSRFSELNYNGRQLGAGWDWQLGNHWKGILNFSQDKSQVDFGALSPGERGPQKDIVTKNRFDAGADFWFHPNYSVGAAFGRSSTRFQNSLRRANEYDANSYELNSKYQPRSGNLIGLAYRITDGNYPNREPVENPDGSVRLVNNGFRQSDAEANGNWQLSGQSKVSGRLGYTRREHDQLPVRDFSGVTGRLAYDWMLEGKTSLTVVLRREIGAAEDIDASYVVSEGISVIPTWFATSKITLSGSASWAKRNYAGDSGSAINSGLPEREDKVKVWGVSGTYLALRNLHFSLGFRHETRDSNRAGVAYTDNQTYGTARFSF